MMNPATPKPLQRSKAPARPEDKRLARQAQPGVRKPAYLQAKLAVSSPGDSAERQADQVAQQVARTPRPTVQRASLEPAITPEKKDESLAPKREEPAPQRAAPAPAAARIARLAAPAEPPAEPPLQRQADDESDSDADNAADPAGQTLAEQAEAKIAALRGQGSALPEAVRQDMETQFGRDLSAVRIHDDAAAAGLCAEVKARAFTVGKDIFFAPGEYAPETDAGRELLAHELTHVVQQGADAGGPAAQAASIHRKSKAEGGEGTYNAESKCIEFDNITIPSDYADRYAATAKEKPLVRHRDFSDQTRPKSQQQTWRDKIEIDQSIKKLEAVFSAAKNSGGPAPQSYIFAVPSPHQNFDDDSPRFAIGNLDTCARELSIPSWNSRGNKVPASRNSRITSYDVDHVVEAQLGADSENGKKFVVRQELDAMDNFELLASDANTLKGGIIKKAVREKVRVFQKDNAEKFGKKKFSEWNEEALLGRLSVKFTSVVPGAKIGITEDQRWHRNATVGKGEGIEEGKHLQALIDAKHIKFWTVDALGVKKDHVWVYQGPNGGYKRDLDTKQPSKWDDLLKPFEITRYTFPDGASPDLLQLFVNVPKDNKKLKRFDKDKQVDIKKLNGSDKVGYFEMARWRQVIELGRSLSVKPLSPLTVETLDVVPGVGLLIEGQVLPTLPVIGDADIRYQIAGTQLSLSKTFTISEINLPPPISIDSCNLTVSASTNGFSADGRMDFSVERLGDGYLQGSIGTEDSLALEGGFDFDSSLFDRAKVAMWYRKNELGAAGELAIEKPGKVRGIQSATVNARYEHGAFVANGVVKPSIPGIQQGNLDLSYSEAEGLVIAGKLQLTSNPAIRSGSVDVTVKKQDDTWRVAATGTAKPAIPGIDSDLIVNYDDGAFTAEFNGAFQRGMLAGQVNVGVTNRTVGDDGKPTGDPAPNAPLIVYGGGAATVKLAPWLQGSAGVRFAPNGEVTVAGEIGLPNQVEIFPRKEIDKKIFGINLPIPIVPGVFAEVGGGLSAHAGIGPGVIDQLKLGVEYNPAHEENTHVTGDGHVKVPADAGLRLAVHGGIGLGIPAASVSGGLEVGGELGLAGAAEAGVHVDWMPSQGLQVDAYGRLSAQPKFLFDVAGYVDVEALMFTIYEKRWQFAKFEYGSDLTFGVNFPIRYREGEPFALSLDDVTFEVPPVSPGEVLGGLISRLV